MKRSVLALPVLILLFCVSALLVNAQRTNLTTSNVPSQVDCPIIVHCAPTPVPPGSLGSHPGDEDGDGIPDGIDQCPNQGGPASNNGCPIGELSATALPTPTNLPGVIPVPEGEYCWMGPKDGQTVRTHYQPSITSLITGEIPPNTFYLALASVTENSVLWIETQIGWAEANLLRASNGGACSLTSQFTGTGPFSFPYTKPQSLKVTLDKGQIAGEDSAQSYCSSAFDVDVALADGSSKAIHFSFGDGSVHFTPAERCIQIDPDGFGFVISPTADDKTDFPIHWYLGYENNVLTLLSFQEPSVSPASQNSSLIFAWQLLPPGPCHSTDQGCQAEQKLDFSLSLGHSTDPANPGTFFTWKLLPPGPCSSTDQTCADLGAGTRSLLLNFLPAVQNGAAIPNVTYFPDSFVGGAAPGRKIIGASVNGDIYGITILGGSSDGSSQSIRTVGGKTTDPSFKGFGFQNVQSMAAFLVDLQLPIT